MKLLRGESKIEFGPKKKKSTYFRFPDNLLNKLAKLTPCCHSAKSNENNPSKWMKKK